ncbi:hypothetical protein GO685_02720 [Wolbachia endosymbiont of Madathamugadia hiepei]|uniref:hypothetical protein n=1 Tax=Wolbachia endosymbiont of Madathamugadia hiepei TaxID=1241303 RepID=UPI00158C19CF|nr:hypothetical protein [Wolbachia endosymbiont of Madathamugadia hiepei]NUX01416.1 hypothetical protein [Wolbachia endosymbiont of Madathamugadia hiepei]
MSKKTGKSKRSKSAVQPIKAISNPIIPDPASVKSEKILIEVRSKAKANNRTFEKDRAHPLSTFSIDSDAISSNSGVSSSSSTISESEMFDTSSISSKSERSCNAVKDDKYQQQLQNSGQQEFAGIRRSGRKVLSQKKLKFQLFLKSQITLLHLGKSFLRQKANLRKKLSKLLALMIELKLYRIDKMLCSRSSLALRSRVKHLY